MRPYAYPDYPPRRRSLTPRSRPRPRRDALRNRRPRSTPVRKEVQAPKTKKKKTPMMDEKVTYIRDFTVQILRPRVIISILVVVVCAISLIWFNVQMDAINAELISTRRRYVSISEANLVAQSQITERYTLEEIERYAALYLGMIMPDDAQIIEIYVPRQGTVVLNMDDTFIAAENHFLQEIRQFFLDLRNRLVGG